MRLIDADKLIQKNIEDMYINTDFMTAAVLSAFNKILMNETEIKAPDSKNEAETVRHGKWYKSYNILFSVRCSACDCYSPDKTPYCSYCGAKMDGGERSD